MQYMKDAVSSAKDGVSSAGKALTGKKGYSDNLLGESLPDLLRRATAKELIIPDVSVNQQVVDAIQEEVAMGKDTREIVSLLKKRLRADKPQKQWLAVILLQKVLHECSNVLGMHTEELLQEVARVMARPAKPDTEAGKRARHAAKDLLRCFGRAGTTAFRHANHEMFPTRLPYPGALAAGAAPFGAEQAAQARRMYENPGYMPGAPPPAMNAASIERQSLVDEINLLTEKSQSNVELLSDMLVNSGSQGADEFENDLIKDLMKEVQELRSVFQAYLEQLQMMSGPEMEQLMMTTLKASDMLDGVVTLQRDVSDNKKLPREGGQEPTANGGAHAAQPQEQAAPAPAPAPAPAATAGDLLNLDDETPAQQPQTPYNAGAADPFAASNSATPMSAGAPSMQSPFERMFMPQHDAQAAYSAMNVAAAAPQSPQQLEEQRQQAAAQQAAAQEAARQAQVTAQQAQLTAQQQIEMQAQQRQAQEEAQAHARYQQQLLQWQAHQASLGLSTNPGLNTDMPVLDPITNPFFDPMAEGGFMRPPAAAPASSGAPPSYSVPPPQPPPPANASNPFSMMPPQQSYQQPGYPNPYQQPSQPSPYQQPPPQPQPQATVDAEWDMFFADRAAGVQQQQQQQPTATGF